MSWRTVAVVFILVFAIAITQATLADPLLSVSEDLNETGDYDNEHFDGNSLITEMPGHWFNMGLVAMFGLMAWGAWRVFREELTRGRL